MKTDVSIIIVNYKTPKLVIDCVKSIHDKSYGFTYEIIVVDNDSQDDSISALKGSLGDEITLIEAKKNLGTAKGYNLGASEASGQYLWYLNSDTILLNNAGLILKQYLDYHPNVADVGANLFALDGTPASSFEKYKPAIGQIKRSTNLFVILFHRIFKKSLSINFNYKNKPMKIFDPSAACMMLRANLLQKVGGWEKEIFMYGEEPLLCHRFSEEGYSSINVPQAKLVHLEGASQGQNESFNPGRYRRFLDGTSVCFSKMYGDEAILRYLKVRLSAEKSVLIKHSLFGNKSKALISKQKVEILTDYIVREETKN
jgi:Predicted glycosyltransferases